MKTRCADCSFKFEAANGRAKVCPSCREGRKSKWRKDQAEKPKYIQAEAPAPRPRGGDAQSDADNTELRRRSGTTPDSDRPDKQ